MIHTQKIRDNQMTNNQANVKLIDDKTGIKDNGEIYHSLENIDLLFIESNTKQREEFKEAAKKLDVLTIEVVKLPHTEEEKNSIRIV